MRRSKSSLAYLRILAAVFFLFALWIFFMADTGRHNILFDLVKSIPQGDKICHGLLYGVMTLLTNMALGFRKFRLGKLNLHTGTLFVAIFAVTEELSQAFFATRTCDWMDLGADIVGMIVATLLGRYVRVAAQDRGIVAGKHSLEERG